MFLQWLTFWQWSLKSKQRQARRLKIQEIQTNQTLFLVKGCRKLQSSSWPANYFRLQRSHWTNIRLTDEILLVSSDPKVQMRDYAGIGLYRFRVSLLVWPTESGSPENPKKFRISKILAFNWFQVAGLQPSHWTNETLTDHRNKKKARVKTEGSHHVIETHHCIHSTEIHLTDRYIQLSVTNQTNDNPLLT